MTFQGDPYRTLGVAPGASLNEIRSAYRRLAKQFHPDAAGERALPRFLAIQAAYEQLVDGEGRLRPTTGTTATTGAGGGGEPWRADPNRARASRDAWRARRSTGSTPGTRAGAAGATRGSPGAGRPPGERPHHGRRGPRKATPGSTSYDEAAETPLDPAWQGGAWYGPTSGTYWTLNPREYADPRKHGPEYQARARRAAGGPETGDGGPAAGPAAPGPAGPPHGTGSGDDEGEWEWSGTGDTTTTGGGAGWGARAWRFEARDAGHGGPAWTPGVEGRQRRAADEAARAARTAGQSWGGAATPADAPPIVDLEDLARKALPEHLLSLARRPGHRWRLVLALVAWPPIGYALGGVVSVATGCARFSASCPEPVPILLLLVQPLLVALLFALPPVTAVAAFASLAALAVSIPLGAVLSVGALPEPVIEPAVLGVLVGVAYVAALAAGAVRLWRRARSPGRTP